MVVLLYNLIQIQSLVCASGAGNKVMDTYMECGMWSVEHITLGVGEGRTINVSNLHGGVAERHVCVRPDAGACLAPNGASLTEPQARLTAPACPHPLLATIFSVALIFW